MNIGIIGNGADKFTYYEMKEETFWPCSSERAKMSIREILTPLKNNIPKDSLFLISGHSPMGGVDIWAEEMADELGIKKNIQAPQINRWEDEYDWEYGEIKKGFKSRNLDIALISDELYIIVANKYPKEYRGKRFKMCYHDDRTDHVKSGACWTGKRFKEFHNKDPHYIIIDNGILNSEK